MRGDVLDLLTGDVITKSSLKENNGDTYEKKSDQDPAPKLKFHCFKFQPCLFLFCE